MAPWVVSGVWRAFFNFAYLHIGQQREMPKTILNFIFVVVMSHVDAATIARLTLFCVGMHSFRSKAWRVSQSRRPRGKSLHRATGQGVRLLVKPYVVE